jgi:hypothetical protein
MNASVAIADPLLLRVKRQPVHELIYRLRN